MRTLRPLLLGPLLVGLALATWSCDGQDGPGETSAWQTRDGQAYPAGAGTTVGSVLANHGFKAPDGTDFSFEANVFQPGAKVMLLATAAEWCLACREEAPKLQNLYDAYHDRGLELVVTLFEDAQFQPVGPQAAADWTRLYRVTYPVVADAPFVMQAYYDPQLTPMIMLVEVQTMKIQYINTGFVESDVRALIEALL